MASDDLELLRGLAEQLHVEARHAADQSRLIFAKAMSPEATEVARELAIASVSVEWTACRIEQALLAMLSQSAAGQAPAIN